MGHKYDYEIDLNDGSAPARVVRLVGTGKRVLEIGAGPGSMTRVLRDAFGCRVTAVEIDEEVIATLTPFCERVYRADLNDPAWTAVLAHESKFDVVIAALLTEDIQYRDAGLLDRTHIRFFGMKNIQALFDDAGLAITEAQFVVR